MRAKVTATGRARRTAGLIVIGDEILKGVTRDTNSHFICARLHDLGVVVKKISVVGDEIEYIADEVRNFAGRFDFVFTTGGVGPTHDDNTFIGLARAFGDDLHQSDEIVDAIQAFQKARNETNAPAEKGGTTANCAGGTQHSSSSSGRERKKSESFIDKLSTIPCTAELLWGRSVSSGKKSLFPVVRMRNVIAFPGVPQFCERAFIDLEAQLFPPSEIERPFSHVLFTSDSEFAFSHLLAEVAERYKETVEIGSYPILGNNYFSTKLTIESESVEQGALAVRDLTDILAEHVVFYDAHPSTDTVAKFDVFRARLHSSEKHAAFVQRLDEAVRILEDIIEKHALDEIALSFNGGKDCTVLLHLLRMVIDRKYGPSTPLKGFHIMCEDQFPEMSQFIIDVAKIYNIRMVEYPGPLKAGIEQLREQQPGVTVVVMGSRASDPKGRFMKSPVEWTDSDWPRVLRVCPILSWSFSDVWTFLRGLCVPYCKLYDQGYTSLGGRANTTKNEALLVKGSNDKDKPKYLPAYQLRDDDLERNGRSSL